MTGVSVSMFGSFNVDMFASVAISGPDGNVRAIGQGHFEDVPSTWMTMAIDVDDTTIRSGDVPVLIVHAFDSGLSINNVQSIYEMGLLPGTFLRQ